MYLHIYLSLNLYIPKLCCCMFPQASTVARTLACKTAVAIPLEVANWLKQPQRFKVEIRAPGVDPSTQLKGNAPTLEGLRVKPPVVGG